MSNGTSPHTDPPRTAQEPTSVLQKMAEIMEYSELLDKAAQCEVSLAHSRTQGAGGLS